jgi:TRAP-type C4-dicarboxylate transport system permease small subunit
LKQRSQQSWWERTEALGGRLETILLCALLSGLILLGSAQILLRNVFSIGVTWGDGLIRLGVLWLALLGALAASREGRHITMGDPNRWLPRRLQLAAGVAADFFAAAVAGVFAWYACVFVRDSRAFGDTLLNDVPAWILQLIMPVAFALISYRYVVRGLRRLKAD